jgi:hypothetical protein
MGVDRFNGQLWDLYQNRPPDWQRTLIEAGLARPVGGLEAYELLPSVEGTFKGQVLRTNRWGMHDKEYERTPPAGCHRIALLGASHAMGSGVRREDTFEAVLEARLNRETPGGRRCVEILNFAVYGYTPLAQRDVLRQRVMAFSPHALLYVAHPDDSRRTAQFLARLAGDRRVASTPGLQDLLAEIGVERGLPARVVEQRLNAVPDRVLGWLYADLVAECRRHGVVPGYVFLPMVPELEYEDAGNQVTLAADAGFHVIDLSDVYAGARREDLWLAEWDAHPNAIGHALVAEKLHAQLVGPSRELLGLD